VESLADAFFVAVVLEVMQLERFQPSCSV
jgi:hypothetical protein